ncbi:differentially expressed in FDCP 8 homolog isoform X2 [Chelonus insularis]|uniref:differentially expressed in FDCP 8 homolog isoform X2 n=1 Tax=Chelonus insularis TaxID=460826 RepID=UPI00158D1159|nr:differentially expressed in FDCP 8 homolog isoform X2 [Chelonus insularis]
MAESVVNTNTEFNYDDRERANSCGTASTPSSSSDYITNDADDSSDGKSIVPFSLKSVEVHLSLSKTATLEDLNEMIKKCKQMILDSEECTDERKWLVRRLIELRLRAQELRESNTNWFETHVILGHHLVPQKYYIPSTGPAYCDHCSGTIWAMLQSWYLCSDCGFSCHWKCVRDIRRVCAHIVASEAGGYVFTKDICPEKGLSAQGYRCAECYARITFKSSWIEPRLCDYTGLYYCQRCHWNTVAVIPARVIRNWDLEPRRVSRSASQLLQLLNERPVLLLEELNPKLFELVPDLSLTKRLREELQMMKKYLVFCADADIQGLPWRIGLRTHMIENSGNYSIKDLVDLQNGVLMDEIRTAYDLMREHITESCELCRARGHLCEICGNDEIIFPWDASAISCPQCSAVHHRVCWSKRNHNCPKCVRIEKRRSQNVTSDDQNEENIDNNKEDINQDVQ